MRWLDTMTPVGVIRGADDEGKPLPDNIFAVEDGWEGSDVILSFTLKAAANPLASGDDGPVIQHD